MSRPCGERPIPFRIDYDQQTSGWGITTNRAKNSAKENGIEECCNTLNKEYLDPPQCALPCQKSTPQITSVDPTSNLRCKRKWYTLWIMVKCAGPMTGYVEGACEKG